MFGLICAVVTPSSRSLASGNRHLHHLHHRHHRRRHWTSSLNIVIEHRPWTSSLDIVTGCRRHWTSDIVTGCRHLGHVQVVGGSQGDSTRAFPVPLSIAAVSYHPLSIAAVSYHPLSIAAVSHHPLSIAAVSHHPLSTGIVGIHWDLLALPLGFGIERVTLVVS